MTGYVYYDPAATSQMIPRWAAQASQMRSASDAIGSAPTDGLPPAAQGAASTFLEMWENTSRKASVASDVYADELRSTHGSYSDFDAEIARRMESLEAG